MLFDMSLTIYIYLDSVRDVMGDLAESCGQILRFSFRVDVYTSAPISSVSEPTKKFPDVLLIRHACGA